jgi:LuxR family transcriptional regulator, maltose regulon positive regulatory protein
VRTLRLRPQLTFAIPWLAVQVRVELARVYLALADPAGARTVLREADEVVRRRPDLGAVGAQVLRVRASLRSIPATAPGVSTLTSAELRLLPLLTTHLTFRKIGERLSLSRHTVKAQAISVSQRLNVSSRGEAVARAREMGLLEA